MSASATSVAGALQPRLRALCLALYGLITLSVPLVYQQLVARELDARAATVAEGVARTLEPQVRSHGRLWIYVAPKVARLAGFAPSHPEVRRVRVLDEHGRGAADLLRGEAESDLRWGSAELAVLGEARGEVWVGISSTAAARTKWLLALGFGALGALLASLLYWLPLRSVASAQARIDALVADLRASQAALERQSAGLEVQVEARSKELRAAVARLRQIAADAVSLQETERRAIAADLHDAVGQTLTALRVQLEVLGRDRGGEFEPLKTLVDGAIDDVRRAVHRLRPALLEELGVSGAIERMLDDIQDRATFTLERTLALPPELDAAVELTVFRVVQEAMTNVVRHANATAVRVDLAAQDGVIEVVVCDDGVGAAAREAQRAGTGLRAMRERVELLGGELDVTGHSSGTTVRACVPMTPGAPPSRGAVSAFVDDVGARASDGPGQP